MNKHQKKIDRLRKELRLFWGQDMSYGSTLENVDVEIIDQLSGIDELIEELHTVAAMLEIIGR